MKEQEERLDNREKELKEKESKINKSVSDEVGDIRDKLEKNTNSNPTHCMHSSLEQHSIAFWSRFSKDSIYDFLLKYKPLDLKCGAMGGLHRYCDSPCLWWYSFDCLICICMVVKMMKNDWKWSKKVYNIRYIERFTESIKEIQLWLDI